jgi:toxin FitB
VKYLLDTMVISEARRRHAHPTVVAWLDATPEQDLAISVLTLGEIERGVSRLADAVARRRLQAWLENELRPRFAARVLGIDADVAVLWGRTAGDAARHGRTVPTVDGLLVATARRHGLTLVTRNVTEVEGLGVPIRNPWEE